MSRNSGKITAAEPGILSGELGGPPERQDSGGHGMGWRLDEMAEYGATAVVVVTTRVVG